MKNSALFSSITFTVAVLAGCGPGHGEGDGRVVQADAPAAARDAAADSLQGPIDMGLAASDAAEDSPLVTDTAPSRLRVGRYEVCSELSSSWNILISPLDKEGFMVFREEGKEAYWIVLSIGGKRYGDIPILGGKFHHAHGITPGGSDCNSDGYEIEGTVQSETRIWGTFASYQWCSRKNGGYYVAQYAEETPADSGIADTAPFIPNIGLDAYIPDAPPVYKPVSGHYAVRPDPAIIDGGTNPVARLQGTGLDVHVDATTGAVTLFFTAAMDTNGIIPVHPSGCINFTHGNNNGHPANPDYCTGYPADTDASVCPGNGYTLNGNFVSPTEICGFFANIENCRGKEGGNYIATLVRTFDAAASVDSSPLDSTPVDGR